MTSVLPAEISRFVAQSPISITLALPGEGDRALIAASPAFGRMTGYREEEILGRDCRFLQGAATTAQSRQAMRGFFEDTQATESRIEIVNYRKDGKPFLNLVYLSKLKSPGGRLRYLFASQFDISHASRAGARDYDRDLAAGLGTLSGHDFGLETSLRTLATSHRAIVLAKLALADIEARAT